MEFFKTALNFEKDTEKHYRLLANKCVENEGIKNILNFLAEDHKKHAESFKKMEIDKCNEMESTLAFKEAKTLFTKMKEERSTFNCNIDQTQLYKDALALVEKKYNFYIDSIDKLNCPDNRNVLQQIAEEEKHQKFILENIIEMIEKPDYWVENAEFYHFDEY